MTSEADPQGVTIRGRDLLLRADGRIGRAGYSAAALLVITCQVLLEQIPVVGAVLGLVFVWCWISIISRRLHDLGASGWWQVPTLLTLPLAIAHIIGFNVSHPLIDRAVAVAVAAQFLFLVALAFIPGREGRNRFGPQVLKVSRHW